MLTLVWAGPDRINWDGQDIVPHEGTDILQPSQVPVSSKNGALPVVLTQSAGTMVIIC